ncbi:MAG: hypothetical protein K9I95_12685 [Flavobacteriaceae bacterium]|jgi:predicted histone-like DNA-binding protein|nr:hypothetical protein [Flavobacteriaceae bacterium]
MSVQFKMVAKQNNIATPPQTKYYPCAVSKGTVDLEYISKIIAGRSSLSEADCYGVMIAMSDVIGQTLAQGQTVKIDSLGTFALSIKGSAADSPEILGKNHIKGARILYKPSPRLKKFLKYLSFKRLY